MRAASRNPKFQVRARRRDPALTSALISDDWGCERDERGSIKDLHWTSTGLRDCVLNSSRRRVDLLVPPCSAFTTKDFPSLDDSCRHPTAQSRSTCCQFEPSKGTTSRKRCGPANAQVTVAAQSVRSNVGQQDTDARALKGMRFCGLSGRGVASRPCQGPGAPHRPSTTPHGPLNAHRCCPNYPPKQTLAADPRAAVEDGGLLTLSLASRQSVSPCLCISTEASAAAVHHDTRRGPLPQFLGRQSSTPALLVVLLNQITRWELPDAYLPSSDLPFVLCSWRTKLVSRPAPALPHADTKTFGPACTSRAPDTALCPGPEIADPWQRLLRFVVRPL